MKTAMIGDAHKTAITQGLRPETAREVAQSIADQASAGPGGPVLP